MIVPDQTELMLQDQQQALDQSRVVLDKEGQDTVQFLTSTDVVSKDDLKGLPDVAKEAEARADELQQRLQDLRTGEPASHCLMSMLIFPQYCRGSSEETAEAFAKHNKWHR